MKKKKKPLELESHEDKADVAMARRIDKDIEKHGTIPWKEALAKLSIKKKASAS